MILIILCKEEETGEKKLIRPNISKISREMELINRINNNRIQGYRSKKLNK